MIITIVVGVKVERESREGTKCHDCRCKRRQRNFLDVAPSPTSAREIKKRKRRDETVEREERRDTLPSPRVANVLSVWRKGH
jgi:hypothetical protein